MFRNIMAALVSTTLLTAAVPAFAATMVKEVSVNADIDAIQNANAGSHWATLVDDLQNAILARLADRVSDDGVKVKVDIDTVELANSLQSAVGVADSKLTGHVTLAVHKENRKLDAYDLTVSFEQAGPFFLPGTDLTALTTDSKEYYDAMIAAFADHVATSLD